MSGTKGLFARGLNNDGTEGLFARGFSVVPPPPLEQFTVEIRSFSDPGVEFDLYKVSGIGVQFTITKEEI